MREAVVAQLAVITLLFALPEGFGKVIYVNGNLQTDPVPTGETWATAFTTVQQGIDAASAGDEVWVVAATYPENLLLKAGVALYGGFAGTETNRLDRNWTNHVTILDGRQTNSVVIVQEGATNTTRIDGFRLQKGNALYGGGILCSNASPIIANNRVFENAASDTGGGLCCLLGSPTITNNLFRANTAVFAGGGVACSNAAPTIVGNTFLANLADTGGGIRCYLGSPTVAQNVIVANTAAFLGGGVECVEASPKIQNNLIMANTVINSDAGGGGISCFGLGAPLITGNRILFNWTDDAASSRGGGGIYCEFGSAPRIVNNTLVGNRSLLSGTRDLGGGIYCESIKAVIANNIIAFGSSGIRAAGGTRLNLTNNCVFGNVANYTGKGDHTGTDGNISVDPRFIQSSDYLDVHLAPDSPCRDAGSTALVSTNDVDFDGQPRIQGTTADIGADESDGTTPPLSIGAILRVSPGGDDKQDGLSWASAKRTLQAALDASVHDGGTEIWVAAGTYLERVTLRPFVHVFGGFAGAEASRSERDWHSRITVLDGDYAGSVVTAVSLGAWNTVDGFTIAHGKATNGGGIYCNASSPAIANNTIIANVATNKTGSYGGGGVFCKNSDARLLNNLIRENRATVGGGIYCCGNAVILNNTKRDNLYAPVILNNVFRDNLATGPSAADRGGGGVFAISGRLVIANNLFQGNATTTNATGSSYGGAILLASCSPESLVANNTLLNNKAAFGAGLCLGMSSQTLANNLVVSNTSGIAMFAGGLTTLRNNCVFGNDTNNYTGLPDPTGTNGNISVDPRLDLTGDGYHLLPDSPCIDAGDDSVVQPGWVDLDGLPRILGQHVDIGAYETVQAGDWIPFQAAKGMVQVSIVTVGGITYGQYAITFPDSCYRLAEIAPIVANDHGFSRDFKIEHQTGVDCAAIVSTQTGAFALGQLSPGNYTFTTLSWGQVVETTPFSVPTTQEPTLHSATVLPDGGLRIQVEGIPAIDYVLQASTNLMNWTSISTNQAGLLVVPAPEVQLFARRFYRVQIGN